METETKIVKNKDINTDKTFKNDKYNSNDKENININNIKDTKLKNNNEKTTPFFIKYEDD